MAIDTEIGEFPQIIHLKCPRLPNLHIVNYLSVREINDLNKNKWMRPDQLEFLHFHFNGETLLVIVDSNDRVVAQGSDVPKQDYSSCDESIH